VNDLLMKVLEGVCLGTRKKSDSDDDWEPTV